MKYIMVSNNSGYKYILVCKNFKIIFFIEIFDVQFPGHFKKGLGHIRY